MAKPTNTVRWIASSKRDLQALPKEVRRTIGLALWEAQAGKLPVDAKVLQGFGGTSVVEIKAAFDGNAFRAVYTVRFGDFVYVLHVFQKKSKKGSKTPTDIMDLIRKRLKTAEKDYEQWKASEESPH
jgi:phage-related protein